ncbi:MAG: rhodanese-like domain-containing protein [Saprospiraceae bacterium]|nr:rhodanese-like domain-containing protein [Saprospiraceae bacterium]
MENSNACEIPRWQQLKKEIVNLSPEEFRETFLRENNGILIDVRTREEWNTGSLPNAMHIDYLAEGFLDILEKLDREKAYFIFCRTGRRSLRTSILMKNWGFTDLRNLDGGLSAWEQRLGKFTFS